MSLGVRVAAVYRRDNAIAQWEHDVLDARDTRALSLEQARAVVDYAWSTLPVPGLGPAPLVRAVQPGEEGHVPGAYAQCTDTSIVLMRPCNTVTMLHEVAHAMTEDPLDRMELRRPVEQMVHGDVWLGNYISILAALMGPGFNKPYLMSTLPQGAGLNPLWYPVVRGVSLVKF